MRRAIAEVKKGRLALVDTITQHKGGSVFPSDSYGTTFSGGPGEKRAPELQLYTAAVRFHPAPICGIRGGDLERPARLASYPGSMPSFLNTGSAASDVRYFTSAAAAFRSLAVAGTASE